MLRLYCFLLVVILCLIVGFKGEASQSRPLFDSIPPKQYLVTIKIPIVELQRRIDTINMVISQVGRQKTVDEAESLKAIVAKQLSVIFANFTIDSTSKK